MATYDDEQCVRPPASWYCTRGNGHPGPCAAHPTTVVDAYERVVTAVEMAVLARAPRWAPIRGLDDTTRRKLAALFAEAHTIADQEAAHR